MRCMGVGFGHAVHMQTSYVCVCLCVCVSVSVCVSVQDTGCGCSARVWISGAHKFILIFVSESEGARFWPILSSPIRSAAQRGGRAQVGCVWCVRRKREIVCLGKLCPVRGRAAQGGTRARARVCNALDTRACSWGAHAARGKRAWVWAVACICVWCVCVSTEGGERRVCDVCKERVRRYRWHGLRVARFERLGRGGEGGRAHPGEETSKPKRCSVRPAQATGCGGGILEVLGHPC